MKSKYDVFVAIAVCAILCVLAVNRSKVRAEEPKEERYIPGHVAVTSSTTGLTAEMANSIILTPPKPSTIVYAQVLTISGLKFYLRASLSGLGFAAEETQRPKNPEDITIFLYTADDKRWRAVWVEDKPPALPISSTTSSTTTTTGSLIQQSESSPKR